MSNQTRSMKVCLDLCGPEPDLPRPFSRGGERYVLALVQSCEKGRERRRRLSGESRLDEVCVKGFPFRSISLSLSLFSHAGSPLSVWFWLAQRKRNPRLKGQESHASERGGFKEIWPHWIWAVCSLKGSSHHVLQYCLLFLQISRTSITWTKTNQTLAASLYNRRIRPPSDATHTVSDVKRVCLCLFISAFFSLLRCSSSYSSLLRPEY